MTSNFAIITFLTAAVGGSAAIAGALYKYIKNKKTRETSSKLMKMTSMELFSLYNKKESSKDEFTQYYNSLDQTELQHLKNLVVYEYLITSGEMNTVMDSIAKNICKNENIDSSERIIVSSEGIEINESNLIFELIPIIIAGMNTNIKSKVIDKLLNLQKKCKKNNCNFILTKDLPSIVSDLIDRGVFTVDEKKFAQKTVIEWIEFYSKKNISVNEPEIIPEYLISQDANKEIFIAIQKRIEKLDTKSYNLLQAVYLNKFGLFVMLVLNNITENFCTSKASCFEKTLLFLECMFPMMISDVLLLVSSDIAHIGNAAVKTAPLYIDDDIVMFGLYSLGIWENAHLENKISQILDFLDDKYYLVPNQCLDSLIEYYQNVRKNQTIVNELKEYQKHHYDY